MSLATTSYGTHFILKQLEFVHPWQCLTHFTCLAIILLLPHTILFLCLKLHVCLST